MHDYAGEEHEEVQPPHHLPESRRAKIFLTVVVGKISEAGHPHIRRDAQSDSVVHFAGFEIVIQ
jgi:hypothetical protein